MTSVWRRPWFSFLAAAVFTAVMPVVFNLVDRLGHKIPVLDRADDYSKAVILAAMIGIFLVVAPVPRADRRTLIVLWAAKVFVSLVAMLFYEWNYGLDAYWYFEQSQKHFPNQDQLAFGQGTANLAAALWYFEHKIIATGSYHSQKILCSFLGLSGIYLFYRGLAMHFENLAPRALLYIGLFPSVLFWSSILGKDPINLFGSCLFFFGAFGFLRAFNPLFLLAAVSGLLLTATIRTWIVPMLLAAFLVGLVVRIPHRLLRYLSLLALAACLVYAVQNYAGMIALDNQEAIESVNQTSRSWQRGGSAGYVPEITGLGSMLAFLPFGMFTALFRPLPGEVLNPFGLVAGLENLLILALLFSAVTKAARGAWKDPVVIVLCSFVLIWSTAYAFISPQNLGAAVRFRLQVMPMMIFLLLYVPKAVRPRVVLNPRERRNSTGST